MMTTTKYILPANWSVRMTGEVVDGKYPVIFCGTRVLLTNVPFTAACDLVLGRMKRKDGRTRLPHLDEDSDIPVTIFRLRRAIDAALGRRAGDELILSARRGDYQLNIPWANIRVHQEVIELAPNHISRDLAEQLVTTARERGLLCNPEVIHS